MSVTESTDYHPYAVLYEDHNGKHWEFCCYAQNAYDARLEATELIRPEILSRILQIRLEPENFDW